ncbi:hypothetical protein ANO14919_108090 [Xylariales sp. No.14919]|nr:hypothetical protein ANO14919_108090 [Xylariales sp. No.14919]
MGRFASVFLTPLGISAIKSSNQPEEYYNSEFRKEAAKVLSAERDARLAVTDFCESFPVPQTAAPSLPPLRETPGLF